MVSDNARERIRLRRFSRSSVAAALLHVGVLGCDATVGVPPSSPVEEPTSALRPEATRGSVPADARVVDFLIDARLDADAHEIAGTVTMRWTNRTQRTVDFMPFHLYMNAFRASDTRWMSAGRGSFRGDELGEDAWGYIDIAEVRAMSTEGVGDLEGGRGPGTVLAWSELEDPSLMSVTLPRPVGPGEDITLELDFTTKLPRVFARTGYADDFHFAGQWFPKPGVLSEEEGWQAHEFTAWSEFFADFGDYEVHLDVPEEMVVGATGILTDTRVEDGRSHYTYQAEMVHDFAWVADPDLVEHWGDYEGIRIRQLLAPEYARDAEVHMDAQIWTLKSMEARFGPYPWSTITIVHPPAKASGAGGMEYPTLYTTGGRATRPGAPPTWLLEERFTGIFVTVHEFGHQFFQGLVASNEHDQPWLDEGVNTFANYLAYEDAYGPNPWVARIAGHPITVRDFGRLSNAGPADREEVDKPASEFGASGRGYGATAYGKAAAVLYTLRAVVGAGPFDRGMRRYVDETRFRHPTGKKLEDILVDEVGARVPLTEGPDAVHFDVRAYLDQALRSTRTVNFLVASIKTQRKIKKDGFYRHEHDGQSTLHRHYGSAASHDPPEGAEDGAGDSGEEGKSAKKTPVSKLPVEDVESVVKIVRDGDFQLPVEVLVEFRDADPELVIWDGQARVTELVFAERRVDRVTLDPAGKLLIERIRHDNIRWGPREETREDGLSAPWGRVIEGLATALLNGGLL